MLIFFHCFHSQEGLTVEDRIQRQVIVADSLLYQSILTFTNQDIPSYIKGGWFLRRAWKIYEKLHKEVNTLLDRASIHKIDSLSICSNNKMPTNRTQTPASLPSENSKEVIEDGMTESKTVTSLESPDRIKNSESNGSLSSQLSEETLARLLGAVNFGYGTFQLCISMVPPKILKLIEFLGFEGDREVGLACLVYTSHSRDMKAPLATLGLLWYHTVLRPFFALDGANHFSAGKYFSCTLEKDKEI